MNVRPHHYVTFLDALNKQKELYPPLRQHFHGLEGDWLGPAEDTAPTPLPAVATGDDGRFTLAGVGRERAAILRLEHETMATAQFIVLARSGEEGLVRVPSSRPR